MTRFLAIIRRFFLGCTVSLLIALFVLKVGFNFMLDCALAHSGFIGFSPLFFCFLRLLT
jgi:hypothetical protein